jgi:hypothetical protein
MNRMDAKGRLRSSTSLAKFVGFFRPGGGEQPRSVKF